MNIHRFFLWITLIGITVLNACSPTPNAEWQKVAQKPPMGWNSFDAYDSRINETEFKANVDVLAEKLLPFGWEYAVVDYIWASPEPGKYPIPGKRYGHPNVRMNKDGIPVDRLVMDKYGRLLPAIERFPSAANGAGFKPIADYVHAKGLKFGIHIMRGIPRQAYFDQTPIKGTPYTAADIAETYDSCSWCNHMFGIDYTKPGAQEYYNSLFSLYAEWEVDFVKADDMMVPKYHKGEIEMMRKAIAQCGRPMILSLSCGEAPVSYASHVSEYADMWRISTDFWDNWEALKHNFDLFETWSPWIGAGQWPDGDMLPFGRLSLNNRPHGPERQSQLTWDEHQTMMTLWSIGRSPLMLGADLLTLDDTTLSYLTNQSVLDVNQNSTNNRQISRGFGKDETIVWFADIPDSNDKYFALFNISDEEKPVSFYFEFEYLRDDYEIIDLWSNKKVGIFTEKYTERIPPHGSGLYRMRPIQ